MTKKIVIASILKPVDDVRAYWKIAQSMAKTNKYEVNIIGNVGKKESDHLNIIFHQNEIHRKQWIKRVFLPLKILRTTFRLRPSVFILNTHELLFAAIMLKLIAGSRIIYDVQENYRLNILLHKDPLRSLYSNWVGVKEDILARWVDHFWFAEKCYLNELNFGKQNNHVIQNKALNQNLNTTTSKNLRILFSGTISTYSGVELAISIMQKFITQMPDSEGVFIGQIHDRKLEVWLQKQAEKFINIQLILSENPISYDLILKKIQWANLGIISYIPNRINQNKIPTKLYEYSRYRLPYLIQEFTTWSRFGHKLGGAIPMDLRDPDISKITENLKGRIQLFPDKYNPYDTWEYESIKIIDSIDDLLS